MRKLVVAVLVLFALAIGIALGTGPLGDKIDEERHPVSASASASRSSDPLDSALATSVAPSVLAGKLTGQTVTLVVLPGASDATVRGLSADITAAGGAVASTAKLTDTFTNPGEKALIDSLGTQILAQTPGVVDATLTTYPRIGALLGVALTTTAAPTPVTPAAATLRETFDAGELISAPITGNLATLTLVVGGDHVDTPILTGVLTGLRSKSRGLVLAGVARSKDVAAVRAASLPVGTFDGVETAAGRIGSVLLLARQITSPGGSFGASGSDGTLPLG
ncbi:copper transporter [Nocardioides sp.]|uniref:copper transporter n=1 Tax=Nocardioides sp. TaxID=35761 RepID=UPI00262F41FE|nr:copper transporter [Nocardioides sp.]